MKKERNFGHRSGHTLPGPTLLGPVGLGPHLPAPIKEHTKENPFVLSQVSFFVFVTMFFLSRMHLFILSQRPFSFFLSRLRFFFFCPVAFFLSRDPGAEPRKRWRPKGRFPTGPFPTGWGPTGCGPTTATVFGHPDLANFGNPILANPFWAFLVMARPIQFWPIRSANQVNPKG